MAPPRSELPGMFNKFVLSRKFPGIGLNGLPSIGVTVLSIDMIKATFNAFSFMNSPRNISSKRGKKVSDIFGNKKNKNLELEEKNDEQENN